MQQPKNMEIPTISIQEPAPLPGNGKFHVRLVEGFYQNLRRATSWPMLAMFFGFVWLRIDGQPLVMFDFEAHRIFLFGLELSWYDLPILAGMMISGTSLLFFMAVGWGRVWCGFACPQSIWTWLFIRIEDLVEGRAAKRSKAEDKKLRGAALFRRILKHTLWVALSLATAITFSGYFVPIEQLISDLVSFNASLFSLSWITVMALLTYANAGLVREKVCLHMCPYSRFQGVMFDNKTRTVSYDKSRGEPRSHKRNAQENTGDCIDCHICVQVCPTGIDIRDGLQAACIDCGACIDACDNVMLKLGKEKGLIEFYSEEQLSASRLNPLAMTAGAGDNLCSLSSNAGSVQQLSSNLGKSSNLEKGSSLGNSSNVDKNSSRSSFISIRLLSYLTIFIITLACVFYGLQNKTELIIEIAKERGSLYQIEGEDICNNYQIELEAYSKALEQLDVHVTHATPSVPLRLIGPNKVNLTEQNNTYIYRVCAPKKYVSSRSKVEFSFTQQQFYANKKSTFLGPK